MDKGEGKGEVKGGVKGAHAVSRVGGHDLTNHGPFTMSCGLMGWWDKAIDSRR